MIKKIGLFGGSFDPVHTAHLIIASLIKEEFKLDKVFFIPNFVSPFKQNTCKTRIDDRLEMIRLAISGNDFFELSDYETQKGRAVYTHETLEYFKGLYPEAEISLIVGYDSYMSLEDWKNSSYIINNAGIIIADRSEEGVIIKNEHRNMNVKISRLCPKIGVSSTMVRDMISNNLDIKYLVNEKVRHYIKEKKLYT